MSEPRARTAQWLRLTDGTMAIALALADDVGADAAVRACACREDPMCLLEQLGFTPAAEAADAEDEDVMQCTLAPEAMTP